MNRIFALTLSVAPIFLALNGCHYYIKMMPDVTISSQPFPAPSFNNAIPPPPPIVVNPGEIHVP